MGRRWTLESMQYSCVEWEVCFSRTRRELLIQVVIHEDDNCFLTTFVNGQILLRFARLFFVRDKKTLLHLSKRIKLSTTPRYPRNLLWIRYSEWWCWREWGKITHILDSWQKGDCVKVQMKVELTFNIRGRRLPWNAKHRPPGERTLMHWKKKTWVRLWDLTIFLRFLTYMSDEQSHCSKMHDDDDEDKRERTATLLEREVWRKTTVVLGSEEKSRETLCCSVDQIKIS